MYKKVIFLVSLSYLLSSAGWTTSYHTLKPGETVADVAWTYYGDRDKATLLLRYNRIPDPKRILPGTRIAIPHVTRYTVKKGDTLAKIAQRFLGDSRRFEVLALMNGLDSSKALGIGSRINIPFDIPHKVKRGESLAMIADRYYGNTDQFHVIASYNFIKDPRAIEPGTEILIPIGNLEMRVKSNPASESLKAPLLPEEQPGFPWLEKGIHLYLAGDYGAAVQGLLEALKRGLRREDDICKAYRFLAYSHIALGERDLGKKAFRKALAIHPTLKLDPTYISPKIMGIFEEVKREKGS